MLTNPFTHPSISQGCFAFIFPSDSLCEGMNLPEDATRVRVVVYDDIPMFALFYEKELKTLTPYDVLILLGEGRISFPSTFDRECFLDKLSSALEAYDRTNAKIHKFTRIGFIAGAAVVACATLVGTLAFVLVHKKK